MAVFRELAPGVLVAGQISAADLTTARDLGVARIVNNRPDGEEHGQPSSEEMGMAAVALGLDYVYAPSFGMPGPDVVDAVEAALSEEGPVLLHCKSGMRSAVAWALASARLGRSRDEIVAGAAGAGYDLSGLPLRSPT